MKVAAACGVRCTARPPSIHGEMAPSLIGAPFAVSVAAELRWCAQPARLAGPPRRYTHDHPRQDHEFLASDDGDPQAALSTLVPSSLRRSCCSPQSHTTLSDAVPLVPRLTACVNKLDSSRYVCNGWSNVLPQTRYVHALVHPCLRCRLCWSPLVAHNPRLGRSDIFVVAWPPDRLRGKIARPARSSAACQ